MGERPVEARRDFLRVAAATAVAGVAGRSAQGREVGEDSGHGGKTSAETRIRVATIGVGDRGSRITKGLVKLPGVELAAVADVYDGRLARAKELHGERLFTTRDHTAVLARPDVDAVVVATPDHLHERMTIEAMEAGKDVFLEKPMVRSAEEGLRILEAQKRTGRICQVGSQRVSSILYWKAKELLASGAVGELNLVEAWWTRNSEIGAWRYTIPSDASPQTIDWDRFLGAAPRRPFEAARLFRWRHYQDYGTGMPGDLFVHLLSGLHLVTGAIGPTQIMAAGGLRYWRDGREVPDVLLALFEYPKTESHPEFTFSIKVNFAHGAGPEEGFRFVGPDGVMTLTSDTITLSRRVGKEAPGYTIDTFPLSVREAFMREYAKDHPDLSREFSQVHQEVYRMPPGVTDTDQHVANFIEAVRTRKPVVEDAAFGLRAAGPALMCNVSQREKRSVSWDPLAMRPRSA